MRWVEMHDWPAWLNPATRILSAANVQLPSGSMITGALFPSSRPTFLRGARALIPHPTSGEPVKVMSAMSGSSTSAFPTVDPPPVTTLRWPSGRPHSWSNICAKVMAENGVWLAGFSTTGQPAAIAGATLWATRLSGKLKGLMAPTTPMGMRRVKPSLPSPGALASSGTISPTSLRASTAEKTNVPTARSASTRAVRIGFAASSAMIRANSSTRALNRCAAASRISALRHGGRTGAARAASTARRTSAGPQAGTRPSSAPLYGACTANVSVPVNSSLPIGTAVVSDITTPVHPEVTHGCN